jgi:hypothetical protein
MLCHPGERPNKVFHVCAGCGCPQCFIPGTRQFCTNCGSTELTVVPEGEKVKAAKEWLFTRFPHKCDICGQTKHLLRNSGHFCQNCGGYMVEIRKPKEELPEAA